MNMASSELLMRQHLLEVYSTVPIFTEGGIGTLVELYNSLCFRKLLLGLPTPMIVVDPDGLYKSTQQQVKEISKNKNGESLTARHWLHNTLIFVKDFENEALEELRRFRADPAGFWEKAKIPHEHIKMSHEAHKKQLAKLGMRLPPFMQNAVKGFLADKS